MPASLTSPGGVPGSGCPCSPRRQLCCLDSCVVQALSSGDGVSGRLAMGPRGGGPRRTGAYRSHLLLSLLRPQMWDHCCS